MVGIFFSVGLSLLTSWDFMQGLDIQDITLVLQWQVPVSLCTLLQRFSQGAWSLLLVAVCILLAEASVFTEYKEKVAARRATLDAKKILKGMARAAKNKGGKQKFVKPKEWEKQEMEFAMDQFLNAHRLPVPCRWRVCDLYFGNDKIGELHHSNYVLLLYMVLMQLQLPCSTQGILLQPLLSQDATLLLWSLQSRDHVSLQHHNQYPTYIYRN